jgi:hypothetical protein
MSEAVGIEVRSVRYALKFLVRAGVVEEVIAGEKRIGWRPLQPARWVDPESLPRLRAQIYTNRKSAAAGAPNVVSITDAAGWTRRRHQV